MYACLSPISLALSINLCLLESSWESSDVVGQLAMVAQELNICTIDQDLASSLLLHVLFTAERSEAPVLGNDDLLATRELVLRSAESLESGSTVCDNVRCISLKMLSCRLTGITSADAQDDLTNVDTGNSSVRLSPSTTHSSLQSIGTGTRQHLVDTDDMVWVGADTEMETFLSCNLNQVPGNTMSASICNIPVSLLFVAAIRGP